LRKVDHTIPAGPAHDRAAVVTTPH
jgi:hypothetical protein